ncbi:MAG: glycosyltransferase family 4 protein [Anaerolineae bacterium]|nr:glycosyltransferase family 4 protein [Anaerolineae bacterium]
MPHVVHLTTVHRPFDTRIYTKECRTLADHGYRVSLIAPHTEREVCDGIEIIPVPRFESRLRRTTLGVWALYRLARQLDADLYHFHDPELLPVGLLLKRTTRAAVIYDAHEDFPRQVKGREWVPRYLKPILAWSIEKIEGAVANRIDAVVTVTEEILNRFSGARTCLVKNYPLLSMMDTTHHDQRTYEGNHRLIYTGGMTNHRGVVQIVEALPYVRTPGVQLILLGKAIDREAEEAVRASPGFAFVDYRGLVPYDELYGHLHSAAIGLICSQPIYGYDLAQPIKLFEYMSAGLPVIASHFELWKEIVTGNDCGITIDPTSPQQIAGAVDRLLTNPELRKKMGENARRVVREKYNWEVESLKLLDLYDDLLGRQAR